MRKLFTFYKYSLYHAKENFILSILLLLSIGYVSAFEVPSGFESVYGDLDKCYTNVDDEDSVQMIEVLTKDRYYDKYECNIGNGYYYEMNGDGTFDFTYDGDASSFESFNYHLGIGKEYSINSHDFVVLFWNKGVHDGDNVLKNLIAECDELNEG